MEVNAALLKDAWISIWDSVLLRTCSPFGLALAVGEQAEVRAAWLPFPSLEFELLPRVYRREGERTYRYESGGGAFVRTLEVNAVGFVTSYPGIWQAEVAPPQPR